MAKTVVVLGAGATGHSLAHHLLKHTAAMTADGLKVILVTPNTHHLHNIATVRGIVPGLIPDEKLFEPLEPAFHRYPRDSWEFIPGKAHELDPDSRTLVVATNEGAQRTISYDLLVIATGSRAADRMPWKDVGTTEETKKALHDVQESVRAADSVLIAGGGATGIETAAEFGFEYAKKGAKQVYWVTDKPLPADSTFREDIRRDIAKEITSMGVKHIPSTKVTGSRPAPGGKGTVLDLTDAAGKTTQMTVGAYVPAVGMIPNTEFVPARLKDARGLVLQDEATLAVPGYSDLFVMGDAGSLEASTIIRADAQLTYLAKALQQRLTNAKVDAYKPDPTVVGAFTLGRSRGAGQFGTWRIPSLVIWWMKGRHFSIHLHPDMTAGKRTASSSNW